MTNPFSSLELEPVENKNIKVVTVGFIDESGRYRIGPPTRPNIKHDNGHLDLYKPRDPTASDKIQLAKWTAMLEGSEALCNAQTGKWVPGCTDDLTDANAAYRHFLFGDGKDRQINYERFLQNDSSGKVLIENLMDDFQHRASIIGKDRKRFSVTSSAFTVGAGGIAPYPATANWQKALGAHFLWVSADVSVSATKTDIIYNADVTIHVEDRYNFNPGSNDVATGIPDEANGRFEITGLAKQYTNYATVHRTTRWIAGSTVGSTTGHGPEGRQRMPSNNRRIRNRI